MKHTIKLVFAALAAFVLTGCATGQYEAYTKAQTAVAQAKATADTERYRALAKIAETGDSAARVAAVMSLAGFGGQQAQQSQALATPVTPGQTALQWASILVPGVTQVYAIGQQVKLGMRQSDNATALGISTNQAFVGMAGQIQAPAPNMTLSGTGVLGSGSYTIGANSGTNSGNSGRIAGESIYDLTHTPAIVRPEVVTQPAPLVVRPEVVTQTTATP